MSKIYSQSANKRNDTVAQHFSGSAFYVNAIAKIMYPIDTLEFVPGIPMGEGARFIVYSLRRPFITPSE